LPRLPLPPPLTYGLAFVTVLTVGGAALHQWQGRAAVGARPTSTIVVATAGGKTIVAQPVILSHPGQQVVLDNETTHALAFATTPHGPATLRVHVGPHARVSFSLPSPGLYHLYDTRTAYVDAYQAGSDVVRSRSNEAYTSGNAPLQAWIVAPGRTGVPLDARMDVPRGYDLFFPPVVAIEVDGSVMLSNHADDAHNVITDANDPTGAAFELFGTKQDPTGQGEERRLTITQPGLYHIYCSLHAMPMGQAGRWSVVGVRNGDASGYKARNAMEAWILVTPSAATP